MYVLTKAATVFRANEATSDEAIVALLCARQAGDDDELFACLYRRHYSRIFALAYGMTGRRERAEDLTQEIFLRAHEQLESFKNQSSFATWFHRLAVNCCLNHCRRERWQWRTASVDDAPELYAADSLERDLLQRQIQTQVRLALLSLKPKLRVLIVMKEIENLSYEEMARRLDCSSGTIASGLNRARTLLARKLEALKGKI